MDEYDRGMDPEVKRYFKKIMNSFSFGLLWMISVATAGLYFDLGFARDGIKWYNIVFYAIAVTSFIGLIYYYHRLWGSNEKNHS